jgi:nucleotide-binding universal stress UspA family protein
MEAVMKILLPLDSAPCSTAAVDAVLAQFPPKGIAIRLLHVVEWPKHLPMHLAMGEGPSAATDLLAARNQAFREGEDLTARAAARLRAAGFDTTETVVPGDARDTIIDAAREWDPDLIVIGSHGWKGLDRLVMGSVSDAIVRRADCSVEVVRVGGHDHHQGSVSPPS